MFDQNKYDFNNDTVQKALSSKYRHKMDVEYKTGTRCPHANPANYDYLMDSGVDDDNEQGECSSSEDCHGWPSYVTNHSLTDVVYKTCEYICMSCHHSLIRHQPKIPPQACANDLELPPIPPELQELTDFKR